MIQQFQARVRLAACTLAVASSYAVVAAGETIRLPQCDVYLIDEIEIPAQDAGAISSVKAVVGVELQAGDEVLRLDDRQTRVDALVEKRKYEIAVQQAENEIDVEFARISERLARTDYERAKGAGDVVSDSELDQLYFAWEKANLHAQQAEQDRRQAILTAQMHKAQWAAAQAAVERRIIRAPIDGLLVELKRGPGEWLQPGDVAARIIRLSRLRVKVYIAPDVASPATLKGADAQFVATLPQGEATFDAALAFVNPVLEDDGRRQAWFDVENRKHGDAWLLSPGLQGELILQTP